MKINTKIKWLSAILALGLVLLLLPVGQSGADQIESNLDNVALNNGIGYVGSDTITKGDWYYNPEGSPIGRYGSCAYILPNPPRNRVEEVVGDFHAPVGFTIDNPGTYALLSQSPWNWTSSQILGLDNYKPDSPYWDEFWTADGMEDFDYTLSGTYMELDSSRSLVDEDGLFTRAACWFAGSGSSPAELDIELDVPAGAYKLSLYLIDWDGTGREETVEVKVNTGSASETVSSFFDGVYLNFFVYLPEAGPVNINVVKDVGANAVVSGVFLSSTTETALDPDQVELWLIASDTDTQGNWVGTYGDLGWVLSAYDVPITKVVYNWSANNDRSNNITYSVSGAQYAWNAETAFIDAIQYPVFEWAWASATDERPTDPRAAYYPIMNKWRPAVWDDGGERGKPEHGYFDFNLHFPEGRYMLSLYTYDWERTRSSQEYQLYDANDPTIALASSKVSGEAFNEGVYEIYVVEAGEGGRDIVVRIYNDEGHPEPNINVLLQGVFVDCLKKSEPVCYGDETAWAYGDEEYANPNWDFAQGNNWGWTNGLLSEGDYEFELWAGAGQNDLTKGEHVGTLYIKYSGDGTVSVRYETFADFYLGETHLWVGNTELPIVKQGREEVPTNAPGRFPYTASFAFDPEGTENIQVWEWSGSDFSGDIYVAAHAVVYLPVECPEE